MLKTALRFMVYDKPKSIGALAGIVISIFLIGQQSGIFIFLTNSMSTIVKHSDADIWVVDNRTTNATALGTIDMRVAYEVEAIPGVEKVYPLVITGGSAKFSNGKTAGVNLIGSQPPSFIGGPWGIIKGSEKDLLTDGAVCTDYFDSKLLGDAKFGDYFEIGGTKVFIAVQAAGTRGFGAINVFTTIDRARGLANMANYKVSAILVHVKPGVDQELVKAKINKYIFGVKAWKKDEFALETILTILKSSGIAVSFGTLIIFATISGFVIIGLTLYSSAIDRIRDYGTLKAIGATNKYVTRLILTQALLFAIFGYIIGYALIEGFRSGIAKAGAFFSYSWTMRLAFLALTVAISLGGALFAIRRITKLEPASVFRG